MAKKNKKKMDDNDYAERQLKTQAYIGDQLMQIHDMLEVIAGLLAEIARRP